MSGAGERLREGNLGMVMRGGDGSGSSSTGLKRSAYPWAVLERERVVRAGGVSLQVGVSSWYAAAVARMCLPDWPLALDVHQDLPTTVVVAKLCLEEGG